jgi:hypothetical protein
MSSLQLLFNELIFCSMENNNKATEEVKLELIRFLLVRLTCCCFKSKYPCTWISILLNKKHLFLNERRIFFGSSASVVVVQSILTAFGLVGLEFPEFSFNKPPPNDTGFSSININLTSSFTAGIKQTIHRNSAYKSLGKVLTLSQYLGFVLKYRSKSRTNHFGLFLSHKETVYDLSNTSIILFTKLFNVMSRLAIPHTQMYFNIHQ